MTSRERIRALLAGEPADRVGFWLGNPHQETWPLYHAHFGTTTEEALRQTLNDDLRWIHPTWTSYKHPDGKPFFDKQPKSNTLGAAGVFSETETVQEVAAFDWPDPCHLDFTETLTRLDQVGEVYRASGFWSCFFHDLCDFFGMEAYFIKMFTHPEVVHAVTRHVVDFYLEANKRFYQQAGDRIDALFFGNDFGTQMDLLIGPGQFDEFVFPYFRQLTEQAHEYGYQVILHSCGSIHRVIQQIIDLGADALHPLQAKAANMDAKTLRRDFGGRITFMGGVDTQELLVSGTPDQVKDDVRRIKDLLGPRLIISPSHEALLPNVPPENVVAMMQATLERRGNT